MPKKLIFAMKKKKELVRTGANSFFAVVEPPAPPEEGPEPEETLEEPNSEDIDFMEENPNIQDEDINNLIADIMSQESDDISDEYSNFDNYDNNDDI